MVVAVHMDGQLICMNVTDFYSFIIYNYLFIY